MQFAPMHHTHKSQGLPLLQKSIGVEVNIGDETTHSSRVFLPLHISFMVEIYLSYVLFVKFLLMLVKLPLACAILDLIYDLHCLPLVRIEPK